MIDLPIIIDLYLNSIPQRCDIKQDGRSHQSYYQRLKLPSELGLQIIHQILNRDGQKKEMYIFKILNIYIFFNLTSIYSNKTL